MVSFEEIIKSWGLRHVLLKYVAKLHEFLKNGGFGDMDEI